MMMHREMDEGIVGALDCEIRACEQLGSFETLVELNEQCLDLLAEQAAAQPAHGNMLLRQVGDVWRGLDRSARQRAASCPYLLVDVGFTDSSRWRRSTDLNDAAAVPYGGFFTVPRATAVADQVFMYAWYLTQSKALSAQLHLGVSAACAHFISGRTLSQIHDLAKQHPDWMRPRWPTKVRMWRDLLLAAASADGRALERVRMHGLQLLASEVRAAAGR